MKRKVNTEEVQYKCPDCENKDHLFVRAVETYYLNTGDFFCHSIKTHDSDAEVFCMECNWTGTRGRLESENASQESKDET